jgi:hypothetical protein
VQQIPWVMNQVRDENRVVLGWVLDRLEVTPEEAALIRAARECRTDAFRGALYWLNGIAVSVTEALAIADGADPVALLTGKRQPALIVRALSLAELMA